MIKVAALTILYHFDVNTVDYISKYAQQVDKMYCFDNSEISDLDLVQRLQQIKNLEYTTEHQNKGLPYAINQTARKAIAEGYQWLITFDQDSEPMPEMIPNMVQFAMTYPKIDEVGIIAPLIQDGKLEFGIPASPYSFCDKVYQSGAMHNLKALSDVYGYDEKLFIDQVDYEYCIRLIQNRYKVIKLNNAVLQHNREDSSARVEYRKGKRYVINKYLPIRYYYIMRNNLYCGRKYRRNNKPYYAETRRNIEMIRKTVHFEENKSRKRLAMIYGWLDFKLDRMGKCGRKI